MLDVIALQFLGLLWQPGEITLRKPIKSSLITNTVRGIKQQVPTGLTDDVDNTALQQQLCCIVFIL